MADRSEPRSTLIILIAIVGSVLLFFVTVGLLWMFNRVQQQQVHVKVELAPAVDLQNLRNYEIEQLNGYAMLNREQGIVRLPIERAMQLEARRPWRLDARFPAPPPLPKSNDGGTTHGK